MTILTVHISRQTVGSVEQNEAEMFVVQDDRIVRKNVTYTPGLYKIFDEIIVNAADNKQRDSNMDKLEVSIDADANWISVTNNGQGIPIEMHKEYGVYVPTLIFGVLLTGSNFDDDDKKTTGGRNGFGAKLANVFSTQFEVECVSAESGKFFKQTFRSNMSTREDAVVKPLTKQQQKKGDYVKISFSPDLKRFKMDCLDDDIVGLMKRRAYDVAASLSSSAGKRLNVFLNGNKLPIKSYEDYITCFEGINKPVAFQKVSMPVFEVSDPTRDPKHLGDKSNKAMLKPVPDSRPLLLLNRLIVGRLELVCLIRAPCSRLVLSTRSLRRKEVLT